MIGALRVIDYIHATAFDKIDAIFYWKIAIFFYDISPYKSFCGAQRSLPEEINTHIIV